MAKTPKFHIAKRKALPWYSALGIRAIAVVLALIVCAFVTMAFTGEDPLAVYKTMFYGAFGTARKTWILLQNIAILLCVSLAVTPAFKMRFWNIGGEGQMLIGGLATAACMILLGDKIPNALLIALMFVAALLAGAVWGALPAICKARWNTNETLFTLMMNYVATQLVAFFVIVWEVPKGAGKIGIINQSTQAEDKAQGDGQQRYPNENGADGFHRVSSFRTKRNFTANRACLLSRRIQADIFVKAKNNSTDSPAHISPAPMRKIRGNTSPEGT